MKHQYKPLLLLAAMFLTVGAMFCMNDILLPSLIKHFHLSYTQATFIQLIFYSVYIIFPIPVAWMISCYGYKISLVVAMLTCALGCVLLYPAYIMDSYPVVLAGLFVISTGIAVINVAANPFATLLGDPEGAHIRINFVQVFSRIGYSATPIVATALIYTNTGEIRYHFPYLLLAISTLVIGVLFMISNMPGMKPEKVESFSLIGIFRKSYQYKNLFYGVIIMFFYVGAEACTAGFFIPYLKSVLGMTEQRAANYLTMYYVLMSVMGFAGVVLLRYVKAGKLVGFFAIGMVTLYSICIFFNTGFNEWCLAGLGIFLSIMFPTLFSLSIESIGDFTEKGSALVNIAIVGGSVFPPIQGMIADRCGVNYSYLVPCFCFILIIIYAFYFTKEALEKRAGAAALGNVNN